MADGTNNAAVSAPVPGKHAGDAGPKGEENPGNGEHKVSDDGAAKAKVEEAKRKHKLKVNGQEEEWDEEQVIRFAQKGRSYETQMQKIARERKAAEAFENEFKKNKRGALEKAIGRDDLRAIAIDLLKEEIQDQADPKSAETRKLQRELAELREEQRQRKEQEATAAEEREAQEWRQKFDKEFVDALSATKLRRSPIVMKRMAELQMLNIKKKMGVPVTKIAKMVEEEFLGGMKEYVKDLDADGFVNTFGEEWEEKVSNRRLSKLQSPTPRKKVEEKVVERNTKTDKKPLTREEWHKQLEEKLKE